MWWSLSISFSKVETVDSTFSCASQTVARVFHLTHWLKSAVSGSGGVFLPSLSEVSGDPHRKEATVAFSSSSSSKSEPLPWDPSSPNGFLGSTD